MKQSMEQGTKTNINLLLFLNDNIFYDSFNKTIMNIINYNNIYITIYKFLFIIMIKYE